MKLSINNINGIEHKVNLLKELDIEHLSVSHLNTFNYDKTQWYQRYYLKSQVAPNKFMILGRIIEYIFWISYKNKTLLQVDKNSLEIHLCDLENEDNKFSRGDVYISFDHNKKNHLCIDYADIQFINRSVKNLYNFFKGKNIETQIHVEERLFDYPFIGFIDFVEKNDNGDVILYELKTTISYYNNIKKDKIDRYMYQVVLYNLLKFKMEDWIFSNSYLLLCTQDEFIIKEIGINNENITKTLDFIRNTIEKIEDFVFELKMNNYNLEIVLN